LDESSSSSDELLDMIVEEKKEIS